MKNILSFIFLFLSLFSLSFADSVRIIDSGDEAYHVRMQLIESAKEEIQISYFIFAEDTTALEVLSLLRNKAREGVKIKVIIDEMFNHISNDVGAHLLSENVLIKNFNKFNVLKLRRSIRYRMHDKMLIVDGHKAILGGRNIEDAYFDRAKKNYDDRDIYVKGEMANKASIYFNNLWEAEHLTIFSPKKAVASTGSERLDQVGRNFISKSALTTFDLAAWELAATEVENVDLLHDPIAAKKTKMIGTAEGLYNLIRNAKSSVLIDSPYLIFTKELKNVLKDATSRGVRVRILTNSLKSTDALLPQAGYIGQRKKIVRMGIELYEYFGEDSFHAKSMVVDNKIAAIGSFNFDPRSQNLNTETMVVIHDEKVTATLVESMDENVSMAYKIDNRGRPEGQKSRLPGASLKKKVLTRLIQYLVAPLIKGLL
jgi:putative cardiolipin synthase